MYKTLLNPFEKFSEKQLLIFGILFLFMGSYIGFFSNAYFDSILHISFVENATYFNSIAQNLIIIILLTLVLFALGKYLNPKTRLIDLLNVSLIARIPFYFSTLINFNNSTLKLTDKIMNNLDAIQNIKFSTSEYLFLIITSVFGILCLLLFAILLWNGFKTATNAKTTKETVLLIITLLIANFMSSYLINFITIN